MSKFEEYVVETYRYDENSSCYRLDRTEYGFETLENAKCFCTPLKFLKGMINPQKYVIYKREFIRDDLKEEFNGYTD